MLLMAKKATEKKAATEQINIRVSAALLDRLDKIGEPIGIKRSHLVVQALVEFVQRHEQPAARK
jgi:predicted transcriptional regulator